MLMWLHNSGVLLANDEVAQGVKYQNGAWHVDTTTRFDSQGQVAMALIYEWQLNGNTWCRDKALALLLKVRSDSLAINGGQDWMAGKVGSCYTQDNGRYLRWYSLGVKYIGDQRLKDILERLTDWWTNKITQTNGAPGSSSYNRMLIDIRDGKFWFHLNDYIPISSMDDSQYKCAAQEGDLLTGMCSAYKVLLKQSYKNAAILLGDWLVNNQMSDGSWRVPNQLFQSGYNGGEGLQIAAVSECLRGLSLLYNITNDNQYKLTANKAFQWLKTQCVITLYTWGKGMLPAENNLEGGSNYRYFNIIYMQTPNGFIEYYKSCGKITEALTLAKGILQFQYSKMVMYGSIVCEGGLVGEWDLSINARSRRVDHEGMVWGNWIFTGWSNCEFVEACGEYPSI
jgi:hypothetical protein